ncbi:MAG: dihydrodipicolinate synthase family protein [Clostridia bacterium]
MVTKHILPAVVTPLGEDGEIAQGTLRDLVRRLLRQGATGFYVGGSSGEFPLLSLSERQQSLEIVREETPKDTLLICHVGAPGTREAVALARHACAVGVDMVSAVPPTYYPYSAVEIEDYFLDIARAAGVPLLLYNVPALAGQSLSVDQIGKMLKKDEIAGVKFTSPDLFAFQRIRAMSIKKLVLIGHDELFLPALVCGADGGIGSVFNILLPTFADIARCYAAGDIEGAQARQSEASLIVGDLLKYGIFPSIKFVLSELGLPCGPCRKPFRPLDEEARAFLRNRVLPRI